MSTDTTIPDDIRATARDTLMAAITAARSKTADEAIELVAQAIHEAVMAERECDQWQQIATAPRDGTPILIQREQAEWPFIGYWANPYRYVKQGRGAWIGHEGGLHEDADGLMWQPLPAAPKSEG